MDTRNNEPFETTLKDILTSHDSHADASLPEAHSDQPEKISATVDYREKNNNIPVWLDISIRIVAACTAIGLLALFGVHLISR